MRTSNQKAKLMHIARMFWEQTDEGHGLTVPQIIAQLDACLLYTSWTLYCATD